MSDPANPVPVRDVDSINSADLASSHRTAQDRQVVRAIAWTGLGKYLGQGVRWGTTVLVARILTPDDYGLVGMTAMFSGLMSLVSEFGIGTAVVRMRDLSRDQLRQLHGLSLLFGIGAFLLALVVAVPLAAFFERPEVRGVVIASSLGFIMSSMQTIPGAILQRELRFKTIAAIESTGAILLALLTVTFASLGAGYWSLVVPALVVGAVNAGRFGWITRVTPRLPTWSQVRDAYSFSAWVFGGRVAGYVYATADFLIVGKVLGGAALGNYTFAWDLAQIPNDQINGLVSRVSTGFYSSMQDDREGTIRLFSGFLEAVSCLSVPLIIGLACVAPEFVAVVLGPKWSGAIVPLQLLCLYASTRVIVIFVYPLLSMLGDVRYQTWVMIFGAVFLPALFFAGAKLNGTVGVATGWIIGYPVIIALLFGRVRATLGLDYGWLVRTVSPAFVSTAIMAMSVLSLRQVLPSDLPALATLLALVATGMLVYVVVMLTAFRSRTTLYLATMRRALRRESPLPST